MPIDLTRMTSPFSQIQVFVVYMETITVSVSKTSDLKPDFAFLGRQNTIVM